VRARCLRAIADAVGAHSVELAELESRDTGKPLRQAHADVLVCSRYFEFYAGLADKILGTTIPLGEGYLDYTLREPFGVSAQIASWNYPLQIGARGVAPALAAGNTVVLKPAPEAPLSLLRLGELAHESGLPEGALNIVGGGDEAGAVLASHDGVDQITFTGSRSAGAAVMTAAAQNVVPVILELGGKSPNLIFDDADLDKALPIVLNSIVQNAGQTCSAGSRVLVTRSRVAEVEQRLAEMMGRLSLGPGLEDPDLGPLISDRQLAHVAAQIDRAREHGADVVCGGSTAAEVERYGGYFYEPTLVRADAQAAISREEVFGPVLVITSFDDDEEAYALANETDYGLVCGVWTRDLRRAHVAARSIESGQVYVNCYGAGGGVELPFGGYHKSGFGREKGIEGLNGYLQTKNVCIAL
jgi:aldehyde dehydrogenase (NAD+)